MLLLLAPGQDYSRLPTDRCLWTRDNILLVGYHHFWQQKDLNPYPRFHDQQLLPCVLQSNILGLNGSNLVYVAHLVHPSFAQHPDLANVLTNPNEKQQKILVRLGHAQPQNPKYLAC